MPDLIDVGDPCRSASRALHERARVVFVDGNTSAIIPSPETPQYVQSGRGAYVLDEDGGTYLDLSGNFGTLVHGHAFPPVVDAIARQASRGTCFTQPTRLEVELAEVLLSRLPGTDTIRFACSGSESVALAIKAARTYTDRPAIAKIEGAYHGNYDWAEVSLTSCGPDGGPADAPTSHRSYAGMPASVLHDVVLLPFNDAGATAALLARHGHRLAAVLLDPLPSRLGFVEPSKAFLDAVTLGARSAGALLIVDEVLGFRMSFSGSAPLFNVKPDLVTLGKMICGGLPAGAVAGCRDVMEVFATNRGPPRVRHGDTFTANALSMAAGIAAMTALTQHEVERLDALGEHLRSRLRSTIAQHDAPFSVLGRGSFFRVHPKRTPPTSYRSMLPTAREAEVLLALEESYRTAGILCPVQRAPTLSTPMTLDEVDRIGNAFEDFIVRNAQLLDAVATQHEQPTCMEKRR